MAGTGDWKRSLLVAALIMVCVDGDAEGRRVGSLRRRAVMSLQTEDGDVVDCVDVYKQPAFDHPLLKNHTLQMWPSDYRRRNANDARSETFDSTWLRSVGCPEGTVPILHTPNLPALEPESFGKKNPSLYQNKSRPLASNDNGIIERAGAKVLGGPLYGGRGLINVWFMHVEPHEYSESKMTIGNLDGPNENSVQVGTTVNPRVFGDNRLRLYTYWTADGFQKTGCFNLRCPGFVLITNRYTPGAFVSSPFSTYNGPQKAFDVQIYRDRIFHNWWLQIADTPVGYWPKELFSNFDSAQWVSWMGEILNTESQRRHTVTQMGNGHFSFEGFRRCANFQYASVRKVEDGDFDHADDLAIVVDKAPCYDATIHNDFIFYGGPGVGPQCL